MSVLVFGSRYSASVWNVELVDSSKKNTHMCGAYTANNLDKVSRMAMRGATRSEFQPLLSEIIKQCDELKSVVESNYEILNVLVADSCLSEDKLIELASIASKDREVWPYRYEAVMPDKPVTILFSEVFKTFDAQCKVVDALIRTQWLEPSKGRQLHKRLVKPIRQYMQTTAADIKEVKKQAGIISTEKKSGT